MVFMETVGMRPVVVHGGGAAISRAMDAAGLKPNFIKGRRYTDDATLKIVEEVLAYETNETIARRIEEYGGRAMPLNFRSTNVLFGEKLTLARCRRRRSIWASSGKVTRVDRTVIDNLCYAGQVPVIPAMCIDDQGQKYNVNADTAATAVAQALGAEKLIYMSDVNGVRRDKRRSQLDHSLAHRHRGPRADRRGRDRFGHDSQGGSLPGDARPRRAEGSHHRWPVASLAAAGDLHDARAWGRRLCRDNGIYGCQDLRMSELRT